MLDFMTRSFHRLLGESNFSTHRYLFDAINLDARLIGLTGARGVGKTTLMLQLIKEHLSGRHDVIYFTADSFYFETTSLLEFVSYLYDTEGIRFVFIDEIHKYPNWNQVLKNIYDAFPSLQVMFSGSSSLDLVKGSYDLSRRAIMYHLAGMSFREYLNFQTDNNIKTISFDTLVTQSKTIDTFFSSLPQVNKHFKAYLKLGYYPFIFEDQQRHYQRLLRVVDKIIYDDIAKCYNLKTPNLNYFKKILCFLATSPPGELSINSMAKNMNIDNKTVSNYLNILSEVDLIHLITTAQGGNQSLRKPEKALLNNTTIHHAINSELGTRIDVGTSRELFFVQAVKNAGLRLFYTSPADYSVGEYVFEIGGKNKKKTQIKGLENAFLVLDDIHSSTQGRIPLYYFGFLY
jgi:uncharacterized protein